MLETSSGQPNAPTPSSRRALRATSSPPYRLPFRIWGGWAAALFAAVIGVFGSRQVIVVSNDNKRLEDQLAQRETTLAQLKLDIQAQASVLAKTTEQLKQLAPYLRNVDSRTAAVAPEPKIMVSAAKSPDTPGEPVHRSSSVLSADAAPDMHTEPTTISAGPHNCAAPSDPSDFIGATNSIRHQVTDTARIAVAKQVFASRCMLSSQVQSIMSLLESESAKVEFAMYAWKRTHDLQNFYRVNDALANDANIIKLNQYVADPANSYPFLALTPVIIPPATGSATVKYDKRH